MQPASQSLALALMDRGVVKEPSSGTSEDEIGSVPIVSDEGRIAIGDSEDEYHEEDIGIGKMFGAISVLQAAGQTILGVRFWFSAKLPFSRPGNDFEFNLV